MNELVREAQTWMELSERGRAHRRERTRLAAVAMPNEVGAATRLKMGSSCNGGWARRTGGIEVEAKDAESPDRRTPHDGVRSFDFTSMNAYKAALLRAHGDHQALERMHRDERDQGRLRMRYPGYCTRHLFYFHVHSGRTTCNQCPICGRAGCVDSTHSCKNGLHARPDDLNCFVREELEWDSPRSMA